MKEKYSICVLDEAIPAVNLSEYMSDVDLLNRNNFKHLLSNKELWVKNEIPLYNLCKQLYDDNHELTGFTNREFFFNYTDENLFSPDIVIFDWDMPSSDPEDNLFNLLTQHHCLVAIYSGYDKQDEIRSILKKDRYSEFNDRVFLQSKGEEKAVENLIKTIKEKQESNFSFKLGKSLKKTALKNFNHILINLSQLSFDQFVTAFGATASDGKKQLSKIDFIDIFLEKLQTDLLNDDFYVFPLNSQNESVGDTQLLRKIWHYRMYHKPKDNIVRKGDIIRSRNDQKYYIVLTSDCHLNQFWKKNLGLLTKIPLHANSKSDASKKIKDFQKSSNIKKYSLSSLTNPSIEQFTILPALIKKDEVYVDYILIPKELTNTYFERPNDDLNNSPLLYDYLTDYEWENRIRITEPFLSPLTQFIVSKVADFGVPDFNELSKQINLEIKKIANEE